MLTILGRPLGDLGLNIQADKTLYIDIDHESLDLIRTLQKESTYIVTNRSMQEMDPLILDGYFNIYFITNVSQITTRVISRFIQSKYADNQLEIISKRTVELYNKYGPIANQLLKSLEALRDDDVETFSKIMSSNIFAMINSLEGINKMLTFCKSLESVESSYSTLVAKAVTVDSAVADADHYKELYEKELTVNKTLEAELQNVKKDLYEVQSQASLNSISSESIRLNAEFKTVQAELDTVTEQKEKIVQEFEEYKRSTEERLAQMGTDGQTEIIQQLHDELKIAQSTSFAQLIEGHMPIFQESTALNAEHIFYFKEVRPTVYINSLISYISKALNLVCRKRSQTALIVVLDPLNNQYDIDKYQKRVWAINSKPDIYQQNIQKDSRGLQVNTNTRLQRGLVLITNQFEFSRLREEYEIDLKDILVIIDRTHVKPDAVQMKRANKFYFINTTNDIIDFGLDPSRCIGFMAKVPEDAQQIPKYMVNPWEDSLATSLTDKRCTKCSCDQIFAVIFNEAGVEFPQ